jgi:hypothetical protein
LERSHLFVSASKLEVQSLAIVEALASGTPVVGLSNETVDELVDDAVGCRLARDATPEEFARCVTEICSLPASKYEQLCRSARQRVEHHDWPHVQDLTVEAYETIRNEHVAEGDEAARVRKIIAHVPSHQMRRALEEGVARFERTARRRHVSGTTWLWVGLVRFVSMITAFVFGSVTRSWAKKLGTAG